MSIVVNKTRLPVTEWQTESGSVVSVSDARKRYAKSLSVALEPIQDLSHGDPSPTNICPISGRSSVTAYRAGVDQSDNPISVTLSLGQTVYGCNVDLVSGVMRVTHIEYTYNGSEAWYLPNAATYIVLWGQSPSASNNDLTQKANWLIGAGNGYLDFGNFRAQTNGAVVVGNRVSQSPLVLHWQTAQDFKDFLAVNPLQVCYELATPQTIQLSPNQIEMLMRNNTVWSDAGVVTLNYARIRQ